MTMARYPISWYALGSALLLFVVAFGYLGRAFLLTFVEHLEKRQKWRQACQAILTIK
jgi:hypothetical protein